MKSLRIGFQIRAQGPFHVMLGLVYLGSIMLQLGSIILALDHLFGLGFHMRLSDSGFKIEEMLVLNSANQLCSLIKVSFKQEKCATYV